MTREEHGKMLLDGVPPEVRARLTGRQVEAILDGRSWGEKNPDVLKVLGVAFVACIVIVVGLRLAGVGP